MSFSLLNTLVILSLAVSSIEGLIIEKRRGPDQPETFKLQVAGGGRLSGQFLTVNQYALSSGNDIDIRICGLHTDSNSEPEGFSYGWDHFHDDQSKNYLRFYTSETQWGDDQDFNAGFRTDQQNGPLYFARVSSVFDTWDNITYATNIAFTKKGYMTLNGKDNVWNICEIDTPGRTEKEQHIEGTGGKMKVLSAKKVAKGCVPVKIRKAKFEVR